MLCTNILEKPDYCSYLKTQLSKLLGKRKGGEI